MIFKPKNTLHKQRIAKLTNRINELEQTNKLLTIENQSLKERIENQQISIDDLSKIKDEWYNAMIETKKVRSEYKKLIKDVLMERQKFSNNFSQSGESK